MKLLKEGWSLVLKVKVNMPENPDVLCKKATETLAKILINKLQQKEINQLMDLLERDDFNLNL